MLHFSKVLHFLAMVTSEDAPNLPDKELGSGVTYPAYIKAGLTQTDGSHEFQLFILTSPSVSPL